MKNEKRNMENGKYSPIISNRFHRTTTHCFLTQYSLFLGLRLFIDERVVVFVTPPEIVRRGVAANIAIDAGRIYVESTADVFLNFVVLIGHFCFGLRDKRYGCVISSGSTFWSNSSPVRNPSSIADSRKLIFFLCAFLATWVALS